MKRRILVSVVLALACVTLLAPMALAAKPATFNAGGVVFGITPGDVFPAGNSGRWVVVERDMIGYLAGPDLTGFFDLTYKANVESTETQAGVMHGKMVVNGGAQVLNVNGMSEPAVFAGVGGDGYYDFQLTVSGHWNFIEGAKGVGTFDAGVIFFTDDAGHILGFRDYGSFISMSGQWQP